MVIAFTRTIILYLLIIAGIRLMGKRQVGELEPSELVLDLIIADLDAVIANCLLCQRIKFSSD